jgi:hypothetical protein
LRDFIDVALIRAVSAELAALAGVSLGAGVDELRRWAAKECVTTELRRFAYESASARLVSRYPGLVSLAEQLLDGEIWIHPRRFLRCAAPSSQDEWLTEPHQDHRYVQGEIDTLTAWVPLHDVCGNESPLMVMPGSHRKGLFPLTPQVGGTLPCPADVRSCDPRWRALPVQVGDVVIFHSLTVHATRPPASDFARLSQDARYQRFDAQVCECSFLAPYETEHGNNPAAWTNDPDFRFPAGEIVVHRNIEEMTANPGSSQFADDRQ